MSTFRYLSILILMEGILFNNSLAAATPNNIDGKTLFKYQDTNYVLRDTSTVTGLVRFANGFTILPDTNHGSAASLDTCISCSGGFDLRGTSTLILLGNLKLDSATTLTNSGKIYGYQRALILGGNLTLAANQVLHLDGNLIIDGKGHDIFINEHAQLMLDNGATVTIQNATIHNKRNNAGWPSIAITTTTSKLTLSDVELALDSDFYVNSGQLFIHNDVAITGTSALIWHSIGPCTIEPNACLYFDVGTTFSYAPPTTDKDLIRMTDQSSTLHLNGCTLLATHTGLRLTKGTVLFDNRVTIDSAATNKLTSLSSLTTQNYDAAPYAICWSPDSRYLVIGGSNTTQDLAVYQFNGTSLTQVGDAVSHGTYAYSATWAPDGKYLAVGGLNGASDLIIYRFNGTSLTQVGSSIDYGTDVLGLDWSPDGKYLAVAGENSPTSLNVYRFNGSNLILVVSMNFGDYAYTVNWSPDGKYLAVGGQNSSSDLIVYRFNESTLTAVASADYSNYLRSIAWSPDGNYLAAGGTNGTTDLIIYSFNGTTLTQITAVAYGTTAHSISWFPNGKYLAVGGQNNPNDLTLYSFNGTTVTPITTSDYGNFLYSVACSPDGKYLAAGGDNGTTDLTIYTCNYINETATQAITNGIILGNSAAGTDYDVTAKVLSGAQVVINGILYHDAA